MPALEEQWDALRPVRPAALHLTLRFLGDRDGPERDAVAGILDGLTASVRPFPVRFAGLGTFPPRRPPRVLWLGVTEGSRRLAALARALERELAAAGFPPADNPFRPHLTLGRFRRPPAGPDRLPPFPDPPGFTASGMDLVTSELGPGGPRYTVVRTATFAG
jgi:2'-5' RNA ligase